MSDAPKKRLPKGRGIQKIDLSMADVSSPRQDTGCLVEISETDREILSDIRTRLEAQYSVPFTDSQVIRWAVWHFSWNGVNTQPEENK
jgi:hypothetical protein